MNKACAKTSSAILLILSISAVLSASEQSPANGVAPQGKEERLPDSDYVLGPDDLINIRILEAQELADKPLRVEPSGGIELPLVGRLQASGLTVQQLQNELIARLKTYMRDPKVVVSIEEFRSQPVSVIGAVNNPGVHQLRGRKNLLEILSMAGGVRPDASYIKVTRRREFGRIPLPNAVQDATGQFSVAELDLKPLMEAKNPEKNILVKPHDVISVPRAEMVYVVGEVERSGGFLLSERKSISALEALSLAGGLRRTAAPQSAKILRAKPGTSERAELRVPLRKILAGRREDVALQPDDILFVPSSKAKTASFRAVDAAIQVGSGILIYSGIGR